MIRHIIYGNNSIASKQSDKYCVSYSTSVQMQNDICSLDISTY